MEEMSSITNEIRKWCDKNNLDANLYFGTGARIELNEIVNRIDREMVELPKDKDGVPIHVGDMVQSYDCPPMRVGSLEFNGSWKIRTVKGMFQNSHLLIHSEPDSLERIANELGGTGDWYNDNGGYVTPMLRDWSERIRKLAKECEHATENLIKLQENGKSGLEKEGTDNSHESSKSV